MKLLQFSNQSLMLLATEAAILKSASAAGSAVNLTIDDNSDIAQNDYMFFGEVGKPKSEIFKVNAAVTAGTVIQADTLVFSHGVGTPLYRVPYNQVKFYRAETLGGDKSLLATVSIDADNEFTTYIDTTNTTGYLFFTLYNSTTAAESDYSAGFSYASIPYGSRIKIREFVTSPHNWAKPLDDTLFDTLCDAAEAEIFAIKRWRFREATATFNSVASQQAYTLAEAGATDLGQIIYATYDGNPVMPIDIKSHKNLNWNVLTTGTPQTVWEWNGSLYFTPIPSAVESIVINYYKNSSGFTDETSETEVQLPIAIAFRVLQDLWATSDKEKSRYFESRYLQTISAMKINDLKQVSHFPALTDSGLDKEAVNNQVDFPTIT